MGKAIENKEIDTLIELLELPSATSSEKTSTIDIMLVEKEQTIDVSLKNEATEYYIAKELFNSRGFIDAELWEEPVNIPSQIIKIEKNHVVCNCAVDTEHRIFQSRIFKKKLFSHIAKLKEGSLVLIRLKEKPGSSRIDVVDGNNNVVDKKIFDQKNKWDSLRDKGLGKKAPGRIDL